MTCRWCKGTGLYQPLTGPSEPCRECQVVASERTLPLADNSILATFWLNAKYGPALVERYFQGMEEQQLTAFEDMFGPQYRAEQAWTAEELGQRPKIGDVVHVKKPQRSMFFNPSTD